MRFLDVMAFHQRRLHKHRWSRPDGYSSSALAGAEARDPRHRHESHAGKGTITEFFRGSVPKADVLYESSTGRCSPSSSVNSRAIPTPAS